MNQWVISDYISWKRVDWGISGGFMETTREATMIWSIFYITWRQVGFGAAYVEKRTYCVEDKVQS